ncbi:MAG: cell division protein FtsZ [Candidatus Pacebacteria bacterium]|nr:cell division protein FtsZ [Candidatus Paceibacterota bacterium]
MAKKAVKEKVKKPAEEPVQEGIKKTKIRVIGIGGGGGNIVSEIASRMPKASFIVANTDFKSLRGCSRKTTKFQFGQNLTRGLGTGMNAELGKTAAQNEKERIKKLLEGQDLSILVACLGGGTGSGAASVFAKISKNLGNLTYGIFTLPFKFEGDKKMEIAMEALKNVKNHLNAITIIPNDRVFQIINKDTPLKEALSVINKFLSESLGGLIETIYEPGLINIDFADFRTILEGRGRLTYLNSIETPRKENAIKDLTTKVLNSPLYSYGIKGAKGVLFNIAGEKDLSLSDVSQISRTISELANPQAKIIFGISQSKKYSNIIKTTLLATGCGGKNIFISDSPQKKVKKTKRIKEEKKEEKVEKPKTKTRKKKRKLVLKKKAKQREEHFPEAEEKTDENNSSNASEEKVRKNALQIRKEAEELEKDMLEKEKFWETPAFLRKKLEKG